MSGELNHDLSLCVLDSDNFVCHYPSSSFGHSRVDESWKLLNINRLLFTDDLVLLASSEQGHEHVFERFIAAYDQAGMEIIT